jgi:hypothetical protein
MGLLCNIIQLHSSSPQLSEKSGSATSMCVLLQVSPALDGNMNSFMFASVNIN